MISDYKYDMESGQSAGAITVFLDNADRWNKLCPSHDYRISSLLDIQVTKRH